MNRLRLSRSGIWQIRKSVMRNVLPAFGSTVGSVLAAPGLRAVMLSGVHARAWAAARRGVVMYAHEWMRDMPAEAWKARHTYSLWAFPQADYPKVLARIFRVLQVVLQGAPLPLQRRQRREPAASGPRFAVQRQLLGPRVHSRALIHRRDRAGTTSSSISTISRPAWAARPRSIRRAPCSPNMCRSHSASALKLFRALRQRTDPLNRLRNSYFAYLLG